jgi:hypothetical protein
VPDQLASSRQDATSTSPARIRVERLYALSLGIPLVGLLGCVIGVVVGIRIAVHKTPIPCPENSARNACATYSHAGEGTGLLITFVVLACILVLVGFIGRIYASKLLENEPRK